MKVEIEYQDQFGRWHHYQTKHNERDAFNVAKRRAASTNKRHRLSMRQAVDRSDRPPSRKRETSSRPRFYKKARSRMLMTSSSFLTLCVTLTNQRHTNEVPTKRTEDDRVKEIESIERIGLINHWPSEGWVFDPGYHRLAAIKFLTERSGRCNHQGHH